MQVYWIAITSVFCVNLTQVKAVINSTNQFPAVSCTGRTRLKTAACFPLQGLTEGARVYLLFIHFNFPHQNISVIQYCILLLAEMINGGYEAREINKYRFYVVLLCRILTGHRCWGANFMDIRVWGQVESRHIPQASIRILDLARENSIWK